ncbi:sulfotransferase domain-containing protein [Candidatus Sumerlaeota bacterium]|nr:sulfotransferase domain-containing protein [Candidatus Sumerlaeota bacterium]
MRKILIYTMHKSASMFLFELIGEMARILELPHYSDNIESCRELLRNSCWNGLMNDESGPACFGPIRVGEYIPQFPENPEDYSIIVHLRDPRDVLTSLYYSYVYSHPREVGVFNPSDDQRGEWEQQGIDEFVLEHASEFVQRYAEVQTNLLGNDNVLLLKYETMVTGFDRWLTDFLSAFQHIEPPRRKAIGVLPLPQATYETIYKKLYHKHRASFTVKSEDRYQHKRQIQPGDHQRKLTAGTIDALNERFSGVLQALQYEVR